MTQIVPRLADKGEYLASESTMYRIFARGEAGGASIDCTAADPLASARAGGYGTESGVELGHHVPALAGEGSVLLPVHGLSIVWSRKIVGAEVHEIECTDLAAVLMRRACAREGIERDQVVLHAGQRLSDEGRDPPGDSRGPRDRRVVQSPEGQR